MKETRAVPFLGRLCEADDDMKRPTETNANARVTAVSYRNNDDSGPAALILLLVLLQELCSSVPLPQDRSTHGLARTGPPQQGAQFLY
jgi:hypothetical protein